MASYLLQCDLKLMPSMYIGRVKKNFIVTGIFSLAFWLGKQKSGNGILYGIKKKTGFKFILTAIFHFSFGILYVEILVPS